MSVLLLFFLEIFVWFGVSEWGVGAIGPREKKERKRGDSSHGFFEYVKIGRLRTPIEPFLF